MAYLLTLEKKIRRKGYNSNLLPILTQTFFANVIKTTKQPFTAFTAAYSHLTS